VALEGPLEGYCRLRIGSYRVVFSYANGNMIQCIFAERRSLIYELILDLLQQPQR